MTHKLTQEEALKRIMDIVKPEEAHGSKLLNLLELIASNPAPMPMQPIGEVQQTPPPTAQNVAASIATEPNPKALDYPFVKRR